jgi:hypothetical protein
MVGSWSLGDKFRFRKDSADFGGAQATAAPQIWIIGRFAL